MGIYMRVYQELPDISKFALKSSASFTRILKGFNTDGTKVFGTSYVMGSPYYYAHPLTSGYDLSTLGSGTQGLSFTYLAKDGVNVLISTTTNSNSIPYGTLSTAWDITSTLTTTGTLQVSTVLSSSYTLTPVINNQGTYMYILEHSTSAGGEYIHAFELGTPYDISTYNYIGHTSSVTSIGSYSISSQIGGDGKCVYYCTSSSIVGLLLNLDGTPSVEQSTTLSVSGCNGVTYDNNSIYCSNGSYIYQYG